MYIRSCVDSDIPELVDLTIETFRPFFEDYVRPLLGEEIFRHQHGHWEQDYHDEVPGLHNPTAKCFAAIAEIDGAIAGFVAWKPGERPKSGQISMLAVASAFRRQQVGRKLCLHALTALRSTGVEVVGVGTGDDAFHAAARSLYQSLGFIKIPIASYLMKA
jgi:ribosomal protein S18 acetylase RimI-like enzyme